MIFGGFYCLCYDIEVTIAIFTCGRQWALNYLRTIGSWPDHTDVVDKRIQYQTVCTITCKLLHSEIFTGIIPVFVLRIQV